MASNQPVNQLLVAAMAGTPWEAPAGMVKKIVPDKLNISTPDTLASLQAAQTQLQKNAEAHLLLFYTSAETMIVEAMSRGVPPTDALVEWQEAAEAVLQVYRQDRRRSTLAESNAVASDPGAFSVALSKRLGMSLRQVDAGSREAKDDADRVQHIIAALAVQQSAAARNLAGELEASALSMGLGEKLLHHSPDEAAKFYEEQQQKNRKMLDNFRHELRESKHENELLLKQLHHIQEELESYFLESSELKRKFKESEERLQKTKSDLKASEKKRLHLADRKSHFLKRLKIRKEELAECRKELKSMRASRSWRVTAPLRATGGLFKSNKGK